MRGFTFERISPAKKHCAKHHSRRENFPEISVFSFRLSFVFDQLLLKLARMTSFTICKLFAESGRIVVTSRAACRGFRSAAVHRHLRRVHRAAGLCVATAALEKVVFGMTEIAFHDLRRRRDVIPIARLMTAKTFTAGKTAAVFRRRMALKTSLVCSL